MISERQLEANRGNAAKSHGPITPEGRAAVRLNALQHGFTAAEIILPTVEEKVDFEQFRFAFEQEYKPVGPTEEVLVEDIVTARWRLTRIRKMEPGFFALGLQRRKNVREEIYSNLDGQAHLADVLSCDAFEDDTYGKMSRYEARFERTFYKALKELQRLQALRAAVSDSGNGTVSQNPVSPPRADGLAVCPEPGSPPPAAIAPPEITPQPSETPAIHPPVPIEINRTVT
jgi:hypothetical protein